MKSMLLKLPVLTIITIFAFSCSTPELQESYDCKCDEIARKFSHYQYEDFVAKWGAPDDIFYLASDNPYHVSVQWDKSSLFTDNSPIMMEFALCDEKPCHEPKKFHCQGPPYIGGDGQTHRISYEVK